MSNWKFFAKQGDFDTDIDLTMGVDRGDNTADIITSLILTRVNLGHAIINPSIPAGTSRDAGGNLGFLQAALDCAWSLGMRPSSGDKHDDPEAIKRHLEDMRALTFAKLGVVKP